jgi:hypothetical protein
MDLSTKYLRMQLRTPLVASASPISQELSGVRSLEDAGARLVALHVPGPFMGSHGPDLNPVTRFILEKYGNDDNVFSAWYDGIHSGGAFAGSIADHVRQRASMAEPFLNFPIEAVRRWARNEITFADQNVENFRLSEEELF